MAGKLLPTLRIFLRSFVDAIMARSSNKPETVGFYVSKLSRLLEYEPMAPAKLDQIYELLIESHIQRRRKVVSPRP